MSRVLAMRVRIGTPCTSKSSSSPIFASKSRTISLSTETGTTSPGL
jgi:hypothetical protein